MSDPTLPIIEERDGYTAILRQLTCPLGPGEVGYYQRNILDCQRAALATVTQLPYDEIPPVLFMEMSTDPTSSAFPPQVLASLAGESDLEVVHHSGPPIHLERWLGGTPRDPDNGMGHCVVMEYDHVLFNPASGWESEGRVAPEVEAIERFMSIRKRKQP